MWTFLAALAGGLVALLGSAGTTYYVQRQALNAERRARAAQAAEEILAAVTELRDVRPEPEPETNQWQAWYEEKKSWLTAS